MDRAEPEPAQYGSYEVHNGPCSVGPDPEPRCFGSVQLGSVEAYNFEL